MPTIIRFLITVAVLAMVAGAAMFYLANFVKPHVHEISVRIPSDKLNPVPIVKPPPANPPAAQAGSTGTGQ